MRSYHHLLMSIMIGFLALPFFGDANLSITAFIASSIFFGTFIDLDHILISAAFKKYRQNLWEIIRNPVGVYLGKVDLNWFPVWMRYITHTWFVAVVFGMYFQSGSIYLLIGVVSAALHTLSEIPYDYLVRGGFR